uniref:Uncharacterized protein n=1 Tax=Arundo donax TaxID=35708 RepID=A0A0A9EKK3_ARUDO
MGKPQRVAFPTLLRSPALRLDSTRQDKMVHLLVG